MAMKHSVYDTDTHFKIDPITRSLQNEGSAKTVLIQYDHNSERFTFEIPRYIEGHDMSLSNVIQIHYINIDVQTKEQSNGVYNVDDMQISPDGEDVVILSWLISGNATKYVGSLNFLIRFSCVDEDSSLAYAWNTAIYSGITVSNGIYNGDVIVDDYTDILEEWHKELLAHEIVKMEQTQIGSGDGGINIWSATFGDGRIVNFEVRNGTKGDKGDKGDMVVLVTEDELSALIASGGIEDGVIYLVTDDKTIPQLQADVETLKQSPFVKLWTNPDPKSAFDMQGVNLNLKDYSAIVVGVKYSTTEQGMSFCTVPIGTGANASVFKVNVGEGSFDVATRTIAIASTTESNTVNFGYGIHIDNSLTPSQSSNYAIPISIYGLRGGLE